MNLKFIGILAILLFIPISVLADPASYIEEEVKADFLQNGSLNGEVDRKGYVKVSVGNSKDILQQLELTLSSTSSTNLESRKVYRATAASPTGNDKTALYLNTTNSSEALYYIITDSSKTPLINVSLEYKNEDGGKDIHEGENEFEFEVTLTSSSNLSDSAYYFQIRKDTYSGNDAMNLFNPVATHYKDIGRIDTDGDGIYDRIYWKGDLEKNENLTIVFKGKVEPGVNFDKDYMFLDLGGESKASYTKNFTFTGITFTDRFSKGPIRQGIDLDKPTGSNWRVRGFIKNMASGLTYRVNGWKIYRIGVSSPLASSDSSFSLDPGEISYTQRYDTGLTEKKYYSSSYDWEVKWGGSSYTGVTESKVGLPTLYAIDSYASKSATIDQNTEEGRTLTIRDTVKHTGHSNLEVDKIELRSIIPHLSLEGSETSWSVSNVKVIYRNDSTKYNITNSSEISTKDSNQNEDGYVNVSINSEDINGTMQQNDDVVLEYEISSPRKTEAQMYNFTLYTTLTTQSGTPSTQFANKTLEIAGIPIEKKKKVPPEKVAVPVVEKDSGALKETSRSSIIAGNLGEIDVTYKAFDTGEKGFRNIKMMTLLPKRGEMDVRRTSLELYRYENRTWRDLKLNKDYKIIDKGRVLIGKKEYYQYLIDFIGKGEIYKEKLNLHDKDKIRINYKVKLPFGENEIITKLSGYNYYKDKIISEEVHSVVRVGVKVSKLEVKEGKWKQGKAIVGKPVMWLKKIKVKNPNNTTVEESISTRVFKDTISVYLIEKNGTKTKTSLDFSPKVNINWVVRIGAQEEKVYYVQAFTPPVIETKRKVSKLSVNQSWVSFLLNSTVRNFAKERYENLTYLLPYSKDQILDSNNVKNILKKENKTLLLLGKIIPNESVQFSIVYKEKPPILIVNLGKFNYTQKEYMNITTMVIPSQKEVGGYIEMEAIGPGKTLESKYGDIRKVEGIKGSVNEFNNSIDLSQFPPGKYELQVNFKKNFVPILSKEKEFYVAGKAIEIFRIDYRIILALLLIAIGVMSQRIYLKKERFKEELKKLKKKIEKR